MQGKQGNKPGASTVKGNTALSQKSTGEAMWTMRNEMWGVRAKSLNEMGSGKDGGDNMDTMFQQHPKACCYK